LKKVLFLLSFSLLFGNETDFKQFLDKEFVNSNLDKGVLDNSILLPLEKKQRKQDIYIITADRIGSDIFSKKDMKNMKEFVGLFFLAKICSDIERDVVFKDFLEKNKKKIETDEDVSKVLKENFSNKELLEFSFLSETSAKNIKEVLKMKKDIFKNCSKNLQKETVEKIVSNLKKEGFEL